MKSEKHLPSCARLFAHTFSISALTVGGGYVMLPLMRERFVNKLNWITEQELTELTAIGQTSPGAMIVNANVLLGYRLLGLRGALSALFGTVLPPVIVLSLVYWFYDSIRDNRYVSAGLRGMRAGVSAVIADTVVSMLLPYLKRDQAAYLLIVAGAFVAAWIFDVNVALVIVACGVIGALTGSFVRRRKRL